MSLTTIGIDLAKNVFQVYGCNQNGKPVLKKRLSRKKLKVFMAQLTPCLVGVEACSGSHYWARELIQLGHDVKILPAQYVKPYVKGSKNDGHDAGFDSAAIHVIPGIERASASTGSSVDSIEPPG